eukprot:3856179-Pyramimonas_sp.AAC.1
MRFRGLGHVRIISKEYFTGPKLWAESYFAWSSVVIGLRGITTFAFGCKWVFEWIEASYNVRTIRLLTIQGSLPR